MTAVNANTQKDTHVVPRPYEQDDIFRSRQVLSGLLSLDESFAIYTLSEMVPGKTVGEDTQQSSLWQIALAGGEPKRLTAREKNASSPQLASDGSALFFLSASTLPGYGAQIYRLPLEGGEAEEISSLEQGIASFTLSPDGNWIAFAAVEKPSKPRGPNDHVRIKRFVYRFDPMPGYLQDMPQAVYLMSSQGGEHKALTEHDGIVSSMAWSPDSRAIATFTMGKAAQGTFVGRGDLRVIDLNGKETRLLENELIGNVFWTADGKGIGYLGSPASNLSLQTQLFIIGSTGGVPVCRTSNLDRSVGGAIVDRSASSAADPSVIVSISNGGETGLYRVSLSGEQSYEPLVVGQRAARALDRVSASVLFTAQDFNTPPELFVFDLATREERALTHHNGQWKSLIAWPEIEHVKVMSAPGVEVEGWVMKPVGGQAPFKTVLVIHGGPHAAYGHFFMDEMLELVGAGYAVAFANSRGSTAYGDAFSSAIVGCWGHPETEDFNAFLDELVRRGIADPDKLGVTGLSGGGHLSGWVIGQTDRFKAAVPEQGVYNMFSMYGTSGEGVELITLEMGGPPHEQFQRYWDLSPVAHAHKCKTPTLLIQGEEDTICPMGEAEQMYTQLKRYGCEVELLRLKNCHHGGGPHLRRYRLDAMKDWFARHIT